MFEISKEVDNCYFMLEITIVRIIYVLFLQSRKCLLRGYVNKFYCIIKLLILQYFYIHVYRIISVYKIVTNNTIYMNNYCTLLVQYHTILYSNESISTAYWTTFTREKDSFFCIQDYTFLRLNE